MLRSVGGGAAGGGSVRLVTGQTALHATQPGHRAPARGLSLPGTRNVPNTEARNAFRERSEHVMPAGRREPQASGEV